LVTYRRLSHVPTLASLLLLASTCQHEPGTGPAVPRVDNHPPAQTADGHVVGADEKSPQHLLAEQGTTAHLAPGWRIDKNGIAYDPKRQPGTESKGSTKIVHPDAGVETVRPASAPAVVSVPEE
jgi:hypothetical protein